jgi:hypothetical protein
LSREAARHLSHGDVAIEAPDLTRYDELTGAHS